MIVTTEIRSPYGWPVFEDGTPVRQGDEVLDRNGAGFIAHIFSFNDGWNIGSGHGYGTSNAKGIFKRPTKAQMAEYYKKWPTEKKAPLDTVAARVTVTSDGVLRIPGNVNHPKYHVVYKSNPFVGLVRGKHWERHEISDYYCGRCGWKVTDHYSYCPECGGALHEGGVQKTRENTNDDVNRPKHYNNGKVECIDWIEEMLTPEEFRGYLKGAALKYQFRCECKDDPQKDLGKAQWYISKLKEKLEGLA